MKSILNEGDEFDIFDPKQRGLVRDEKNGEVKNQGRGWIAHVIKPDTIYHTGSHLAIVSRRWFDGEVENPRRTPTPSGMPTLHLFAYICSSEKA
jgi:hypothetical protein